MGLFASEESGLRREVMEQAQLKGLLPEDISERRGRRLFRSAMELVRDAQDDCPEAFVCGGSKEAREDALAEVARDRFGMAQPFADGPLPASDDQIRYGNLMWIRLIIKIARIILDLIDDFLPMDGGEQ